MAKRKPKPNAELDLHSARQQGESREGLRKRIRDLQQELSRQVESNSRLRQSKFTLAKTGKAKPVKGSYRRVCVPDTHGCHVDQKAIAAFLGDLEHVQPQEIVLLGDHLDCGGFLAQHHTLGYVAETENGFEDDVVATNMLLDRLHELSPNSQKFYLEGNHDARLERFCVTQALRKGTDAKFLLDRIGPQAVLHLEQRGIPYFRRSERYDGLPIPGTIKLGRCHFTHGEYTGKHAASQALSRFGGNVVFAHTHRADSYMQRSVHAGVIGAWNPGCLCKLQPYWNHTRLTDWSHGYGLQLVEPDGSFLHINVPIIEGRSYLASLLSM